MNINSCVLNVISSFSNNLTLSDTTGEKIKKELDSHKNIDSLLNDLLKKIDFQKNNFYFFTCSTGLGIKFKCTLL